MLEKGVSLPLLQSIKGRLRALRRADMAHARAVVIALVTVSVCVFLALVPRARAVIWSGIVLDLVVVATVLVIVGLVCSYGVQRKLLLEDERKTLRDRLVATGGIILTCAALYVSYASFRNQTRLSAEQALNVDGSGLLDIEVGDPNIRCMYYNYGFSDHDTCLKALMSDHDKWSKTMFYVEEAWYALQRARREDLAWGSGYSATMDYWIKDLERDPLGLFSYYQVASSDSLALAVEEVKTAGVHRKLSTEEVEAHLCERFLRVWIPLGHKRPRSSEASGGIQECLARVPEPQRSQVAPQP